MEYEKNTRGYLYYAFNSEEINYLKLAISSAITGRYYIDDFRATIVTDEHSMKFLNKKNEKLLQKCFETILFEEEIQKHSKLGRRIKNNNITRNNWYNTTRTNAFIDSKYEQTILVDADYIFQNNKTNLLWNSKTPIRMNKDIISLTNKKVNREMVGNFTIPMYWATLVYFNRSGFSKNFFNVINHIQENYEFYCILYQIYDQKYRNDHTFSIALHMMNGFRTPEIEYELPFKYIMTSRKDVIHQLNVGSTRFLVWNDNWKSPWHYLNLKDISYHCLNKKTLLDLYDTFINFYDRDQYE